MTSGRLSARTAFGGERGAHCTQPGCRGSGEMNQNQIISTFVRGAAWQLMPRSLIWILILSVSAAWPFASGR
jgi:hypothetical protein